MMKLWSIFFLSLVLRFSEVTGGNCPDLYQRYSSKHTFCLDSNSSCKIRTKNLSKKDIDVILHEHNSLRSRVATGKETTYNLPKASNMMQIVWDEELAAVAQKHAEQCEFQHDCNECRRVKNFGVGQNLYETILTGVGLSPPRPNWAAAIDSWYQEAKDFDKKQLGNFSNGQGPPQTGHFTQVIWASTWRIGCGYILHEESDSFIELYTCNYGPEGNFIGEPLYQRGNPCGKCPLNSCCDNSCAEQKVQMDYPGLCKILGDNGPQYSSPSGLLFFCQFNGEPDCAHVETPEGNKWIVSHTLSGSYIEVVLSGGQSSTINFTTAFKPKVNMCFSSFYRKGPTVAGHQEVTNMAQEIFSIPHANTEAAANLTPNTAQGIKFDMQLNWKYETMFAVHFIVPEGSLEQYFQISYLEAKEGKC